MRFETLAVAALSLALAGAHATRAQDENALRIAPLLYNGQVVPGEIFELRVEGLGQRFTSPPSGGELQVQVTQDGSTQTVAARTATPVFIREGDARLGGTGGEASSGLKAYQSVSFVVPRTLHAGEAEVVVAYRRLRSAPARLTVVERPPRPLIGGAPIISVGPSGMTAPPRAGDAGAIPGLRLERGAKKVELHVRPLFDPADADAAVLVRFRQGGAYYDAPARVVHQEGGTQNLPSGGVRLSPARDVLEVDVPELLAPGEAELEVSLRAGAQTSEAATLRVTITDAERASEAPKEAAPRLLAVTPRRVGAGQALMISVDRRRALDPDPSKVQLVFEAQDGTRYAIKPEMNSAVRRPDAPPDSPVLLVARPSSQIIGPAMVRLVNPAREEYAGASSEPALVEIVEEAQPPRLVSVNESTKAELAQLRQLYEAQTSAGREFTPYDPSARYLTIRAEGLDYNPRFLRVRLEQEGREAVTLGYGDFSLFTDNAVVVRVPNSLGAGATRVTVESRGERGYSAPAAATFELRARK
ncbi:MAG: hypothetical protein M3444_09030 [Acidobacteriota bacterium]|nr:hypothetical protein [Acidobacteriota bacterium]